MRSRQGVVPPRLKLVSTGRPHDQTTLSSKDFLSTFLCGTIFNTYTLHSPYRRETVPTILPLLDYVEDFEPGFHVRTRIPIVRPFTSHEFHTWALVWCGFPRIVCALPYDRYLGL
ncbi:hypothetical protein CRG98_035507 [Punica granatum]|uniref:Uncharacterized protein n=1 Tax=Punica granatum TaxID=22663 RepID=A0A2I0IJC3_PUNGR|nr:hypothetical protein CRG98_035507 [Punica granatum]